MNEPRIEDCGTHHLIALDLSRSVGGEDGSRLRAEIARRHRQTIDNGGTTLTLEEWRNVFRLGFSAGDLRIALGGTP